MSSGSNPNLDKLNAAFDKIDTATTAIGTGVAGVATRIQALVDQIANGASPAQLQAFADKAGAEVDKLQPFVDSLNAMGSDPSNPVPVPVPPPDNTPPSQ